MSLTFIHGPVTAVFPILFNVFKFIPGIVEQSDTVNDLILFIGHCDLHFLVQHIS